MLSVILCCAAFIAVSTALPGGAPLQACDSLLPAHGVGEQTTPNPWMIDITGFNFNDTINMLTYVPGETYNGKSIIIYYYIIQACIR